MVAYKSEGYSKFSRFNRSCFVPYDWNGNESTLRGLEATVEALLEHDKNWMKPVEVMYGRAFSRKRKLK